MSNNVNNNVELMKFSPVSIMEDCRTGAEKLEQEKVPMEAYKKNRELMLKVAVAICAITFVAGMIGYIVCLSKITKGDINLTNSYYKKCALASGIGVGITGGVIGITAAFVLRDFSEKQSNKIANKQREITRLDSQQIWLSNQNFVKYWNSAVNANKDMLKANKVHELVDFVHNKYEIGNKTEEMEKIELEEASYDPEKYLFAQEELLVRQESIQPTKEQLNKKAKLKNEIDRMTKENHTLYRAHFQASG